MKDSLEHTYQGTRHYLPLDGLRGIAISLVFWVHYMPPFKVFHVLWLGWTGVDLFFVLSGFLITGILFDTLQRPQFFRTFYIRRALRIFPLYYAFWAVAAGAAALTHAAWAPPMWAWLVYGGNYLHIHAAHQGLPNDIYGSINLPVLFNGYHPAFIIRHFWSLCVEEQYYLIWPLIVFWLKDRRRLMYACVVGIVLTIATRFLLARLISPAMEQSGVIYEFTFARTDSLLMGGWLALALRGPQGHHALRAKPVYIAGVVCFVVFILQAIHHGEFVTGLVTDLWINTYGFSLVGIVASAVLVAALRVSWFKRMLLWPPLLQLGRISYSFYVLHFIPLGLFTFHITTRKQDCVFLVFAFAFTWALSWLSYHYFEQPFLRLKDRFAPQRERPVPSLA